MIKFSAWNNPPTCVSRQRVGRLLVNGLGGCCFVRTSLLLHHFPHFSSARYTGPKTRRISLSIPEHVPAYLQNDTVTTLNSATQQHMVDTRRQNDQVTAFMIVLAASRVNNKVKRENLLKKSEVPAIWLLKPGPCKRLYLVQSLMKMSAIIFEACLPSTPKFSSLFCFIFTFYLTFFIHKFLHLQLITTIPRTMKLESVVKLLYLLHLSISYNWQPHTLAVLPNTTKANTWSDMSEKFLRIQNLFYFVQSRKLIPASYSPLHRHSKSPSRDSNLQFDDQFNTVIFWHKVVSTCNLGSMFVNTNFPMEKTISKGHLSACRFKMLNLLFKCALTQQ